MSKKRSSGLLLHITSLPSQYGIGDLGPGAYRFVDFLCDAGQKFWQVLPINPVAVNTYPSPYSGLSAFAGFSSLLSPEVLYCQGLLGKNEIITERAFPEDRVDYKAAMSCKRKLLNIAFERFRRAGYDEGYFEFCKRNEKWLGEYAVFMVLRNEYGRWWQKWPKGLRDNRGEDVQAARKALAKRVEREMFFQYEFARQWRKLKEYCNNRGVSIIGDMPIYVSGESVDVWANPEVFRLYKNKMPQFVSGTPPDMFCDFGQLWGSPVYDWKYLRTTRYKWWIDRVGRSLDLFDMLRLDHFRGLVSYWEVPARAKTAAKGHWVEGGGQRFFNALFKHYPVERFVAEDLGHITDDVRKVIKKFDITSSRVVMFGLDGKPRDNEHWPGNFMRNCAAYTGTHDNNTAVGWFENEANDQQKKRLLGSAKRKVSPARVSQEMVALAMASRAKMVIVQMQDVLGLGAGARMNVPGTLRGNWVWRVRARQLNVRRSQKLMAATANSGRVG